MPFVTQKEIEMYKSNVPNHVLEWFNQGSNNGGRRTEDDIRLQAMIGPCHL